MLRHSRVDKTADNESSIQQFIVGYWATWQLQNFVYSRASLDGKPLWSFVAHSLEDAKAYYAEILEESPDQARYEAAEALVLGGWTYRDMNHALS